MYKVLVDIDGVIMDLHTELENRVRDSYSDFSMKDVVTYNFNKDNGKDFGSMRGYILKLLNVPDIYLKSKPFKDGVSALKKLMDREGIEVTISSLAGEYNKNTLEIAGIKAKQMCELFEGCKFSLDIVVGDSKQVYDADFVIDDCAEYLQEYSKKEGVVKYLTNKSYNTERYYPQSKDFVRVDSLADAVNDILNSIK